MNFYVSDTHALFWYLINSPALGVNARLAFDDADAGPALIYIPAIVIAELYYPNEKKDRPLDFRTKYAHRPARYGQPVTARRYKLPVGAGSQVEEAWAVEVERRQARSRVERFPYSPVPKP